MMPPAESPSDAVRLAYTAPFAHPRAVLMAFWPLVPVIALTVLATTDAVMIETPLVGLLPAVLVWITMAAGAVAWHRFLILDAARRWTAALPDLRALSYIGWSLLIGLVAALVFFIPGLLIGLAVGPSFATLLIVDAGSVGARLLGIAINVVLTALYILIFGEALLRLARASVAERSGRHAIADLAFFGARDRFIPLVLMACSLPAVFLAGLVEAFLTGRDIGLLGALVILAVWAYGGLVFLSGLSVLYRTYLAHVPPAEPAIS